MSTVQKAVCWVDPSDVRLYLCLGFTGNALLGVIVDPVATSEPAPSSVNVGRQTHQRIDISGFHSQNCGRGRA